MMNGEARRRADAYLKGGLRWLGGLRVERRAAGRQFIDKLKLLYRVANIGDARSVRLSVGIEHIDGIIADIDQALSIAQRLLTAASPAHYPCAGMARKIGRAKCFVPVCACEDIVCSFVCRTMKTSFH